MKKIGQIPIFVKKHLDYILGMIILFILITPREIWDRRYGQFSFCFVVFLVLTLLLVLAAASDFIEKKCNFSKWFGRNVWLISFTLLIFIAVLFSADRSVSLLYIPYYLSGIFLAFIIDAGEFTYEKLKRIFSFAACGLFLAAVWAVIQRIQGVDVNASFTNLTVNPNMPGRVESFFGNPNICGFVLASVLPVTAAYIFIVKSRLMKVFGAVSFLLGTAALIMTYSRGCWFAFAAGMFLLIVLYRPKLIPFVLVIGVAAIPFLPDSIKQRALTVFNPNDTSISYRGLLMSCAVRLIADYPIFGVGPGPEITQGIVHQIYWPSDLDPIYRFYHSHNTLLQMWCEMGVFACIAFVGAIIYNLSGALKGFQKKSDNYKIFTASLISGMSAMLLCGIADSPLSTLRTMLLFWILFGLTGSMRRIEK